eukprot:COSAG01_NODE_3159_length_6488_cov_8.505400_3_plen_153_part_00
MNYLLRGEKIWRVESHYHEGMTLEVTQVAGDLVWLPPGWYHSVKTTKGGVAVMCTDGQVRDFSISMPMFATPISERRRIVSEWGTGLVKEAQSHFTHGSGKRLAKPGWHFPEEPDGKKAKREKHEDPVLIPPDKLRKAIRATLAHKWCTVPD